MKKLNVTKEIKKFKKAGKFPPEAINLNKLKNSDGFWVWPVDSAKMFSGASFERAKSMGDLIMFLNMAALAWEKVNRERK